MKLPILLLFLAACATVPPPRVVTQAVYVPQPVACIDRSKVPAAPVPLGALPTDARQAADLLAAAVLDRNATINELLALVGPCTRVTSNER